MIQLTKKLSAFWELICFAEISVLSQFVIRFFHGPVISLALPIALKIQIYDIQSQSQLQSFLACVFLDVSRLAKNFIRIVLNLDFFAELITAKRNRLIRL